MNRLKKAINTAVAVLIACYLAGNVTSFVHLGFTRHSFCLEHGHVVDLDDEQENNSISVNTRAVTGQRAHIGVGNNRHHDSHDHCLLAETSNPRFAFQAVYGQKLFCSRAHKQWRTSDDIAALSSFDLLRLAPKQSPPLPA